MFTVKDVGTEDKLEWSLEKLQYQLSADKCNPPTQHTASGSFSNSGKFCLYLLQVTCVEDAKLTKNRSNPKPRQQQALYSTQTMDSGSIPTPHSRLLLFLY